jgi:hypothetical protein
MKECFKATFVGEFSGRPRKRGSRSEGLEGPEAVDKSSHFDSRRYNFLYILYIPRVYNRYSLGFLFPSCCSVVLSYRNLRPSTVSSFQP